MLQFKRSRAQELTIVNRQDRRAEALLRFYSMYRRMPASFSSLFTVAVPSNTQNDRVYAPHPVPKKHISSNVPDQLSVSRLWFPRVGNFEYRSHGANVEVDRMTRCRDMAIQNFP